MTNRDTFRYDVFVSCSEPDEEWVEKELLPHLEGAGLRVAVPFRDLPLGAPRLENAEWAVQNSHRTLIVLTPDWLASDWNAFEALLVRTLDPAARQRKLLPVVARSCQPPEAIQALETLDLTGRQGWERKMHRLVWSVWAAIPEPAPWESEQPRDLNRWQRWARRHRRPLRGLLAGTLGAWLLLFLALQLPPFQPRLVWTSLGLDAPDAMTLARSGDVLLVGGANPREGCDQMEMGLWRSADGGQTWQTIAAPALCTERPGQGEVLADVMDLAAAPARPGRVYAATSDVGLLRSDEDGLSWAATAGDGLHNPKLTHLAVDTADAQRVYVATVGGGLYRSDDGGQRWQRLDDREPGAAGCQEGDVLTGTLLVGALLVTPERLFAGTGDPFALTDRYVPGGLYASADGGECWQALTDDPGRYEYKALAVGTGAARQALLALARDWWLERDSAPDVVLRLDLTSFPAAAQLLWRQDHAVAAMIAVEGVAPAWYAATDLGEVVRGQWTLAEPEKLPGITRCLPACRVDLLPGASGEPPLLLARGRVYRLGQGAWWRRLWP